MACPAVVAMDLELPNNAGAEGVATLKKHFSDAYFIALSGAPAAEYEVDFTGFRRLRWSNLKRHNKRFFQI